jgi:drug/metabolite transporter (DMT)-like permease
VNINFSHHTKAVLQALLVTFLWSTSWVLIKVGLEDIPALTFAGLRYSLATLCLLPLAFLSGELRSLRGLRRREWLSLIILGVLFYALTQGAQFLGLVYLPAVTVSLLLSFTAPTVALLGIPILHERPRHLQWTGMLLFLVGVVFYFYPVEFPYSQVMGLGIVLVGVLANAFSSILGRDVNRSERLNPMVVTFVSMGVGAVLLLVSGILIQGIPTLDLDHWLIIFWLAIINTAFAFTLWNRTLRSLTALESSIINNTMLIQIAVLAWLFLGELLSVGEIVGLFLVGVGAILVQLRRK